MLLALLAAPAFAAAPTAYDGTASVAEDNAVNISLRAVDPEGQALTYAVVTAPAHGSVSIAGAVATYRPLPDWNGTDTFTWRARDTTRATSNVATQTVTVRAVNDAPTGGNASVSATEDTPLTFTLPGSDVDGDTLTWSIVAAPANGTATVIPATGVVTFTPTTDFVGATSLRYQVTDGTRSSGGTISITVAALNDAPTGVPQSVSMAEDSGSISLTLSGTDPDGDPLTYAIATTSAHGTLGLTSRRAVYTPETDFYGTDVFTFVVSDGVHTSAPTSVTITVTAVDDPPVVYGTSAMTDGRSIQIQTYTSDIDSALGAPTIAASPTHGRAWMSGSRVRYTPDAGFIGTDHVTIRVTDGVSNVDGTIKISVLGTPLGAQSGWAQFGVNSVPFYGDATGTPDTASTTYQGSYILDDFYDFGIESFRQLRAADVTWESFEPNDGSFVDQDTADLFSRDEVEPRVTVFDTMFASPTPPWAEGPADFQKSMNARAYQYLDEVMARYGDQIRYWEVGNEMFHWVSVDTPPDDPSSIPDLPDSFPLDGYSPEEQAEFLRDAAEYIRAHDDDAVIVLASVLADSPGTNEWLERVINHVGSDWFDVVTYHSYETWSTQRRQRANFDDELELLGLQDKLVQLTETGTSSYVFQTAKTNYPNSPTTQASDVFRLSMQAFAAGDSTVVWHTYREFTEDDHDTFGGLGLLEHDATPKPAAYAVQLLTSQLFPIVQVTDLSEGTAYIYEVRTQGGLTSRVMWGSGSVAAPGGFSSYTSVMPSSSGTYTWASLGSTIALSDTPILVK